MITFRPELKALSLIVAIAFGAALIVAFTTRLPRSFGVAQPTAPGTVVAAPSALPSTLRGPLTGLPTRRALATRRPLAVVIDNFFPDARPQTGLSRASVVFEAPVEGGITRLLAIYLEDDAPTVGPIRSARPYFVAWAAGFRAVFVHAGGSPAALKLLPNLLQVGDLEALRRESEFHRLKDKPAPHNLFSSTTAMRAAAQRNGIDSPLPFIFSAHKPEAVLWRRGRAQTIHVDFSTLSAPSPSAYAVSYRYLRRRDVYVRAQGGVPFVDSATNRPVTTDNVVILFVGITPIPNDRLQRVTVKSTGSGRALYLRDGHVVRGFWRKRSISSPLLFLASGGAKVSLDRGNTWIEAVPPGGVHYSES
ncbi:MAG: DUF3048 domain-containing protein [Chloroflexota bacterium]|nr:DUF3048 domain-containing protein [Chloroflexota bacterium]